MHFVTDLYEVTMAGSYLRRGMTEAATFSLFVRRFPAGWGFLVAVGLDDALEALAHFEITSDDVTRLASTVGCEREFVAPLEGLRFTGDVLGVPEGRVVLPGEPLLEITAPLPQAQLVESLVLNALTFRSAVATTAARCVLAAGNRPVIDFSLRRTHGIEAADAVARVSAIAGFAATSNVAAAARHGLRATGTMAHAYVQAFGDDETAFRAFAADVPVAPTFLVDTFELADGVRAAARVIRELGLEHRAGVRIDSGDLGAGARLARSMLDAAGLPRVRIVVSGGLDERGIARLRATDAPVDVFAVGSALGVSAGAPVLDSAYKLVQLGARPVLKLSPGKVTDPGPRQVWRAPELASPPWPDDLLACRHELSPGRGWEALLVPAMRGGRRLAPSEGVAAARERCVRDLARLPAALCDLDAVAPAPRRSAALVDLAERVRRVAGQTTRTSVHG